ncbi:hypothetical protein EI005_25685 [Escherichia coli]|nr:hypothetical protein [Escherichia coli]
MPIVGGHILELGTWVRKKAEQVMGSKPVSSTPPWPLLQFLLSGSCLEFLASIPSMNLEVTFQVVLIMVFYHNNEKPNYVISHLAFSLSLYVSIK